MTMDRQAGGNSATLTADDAAKLLALRRTKAVATGALVMCILVFLGARALQDAYPGFAYVAAFAEAAAIGGLADWYAVVALFRRPLGLPIPHTAIIPENRDRIATNLGGFIEANFLAPEPVREKLRQVDFAAMVADWLSDRERSHGLSNFVARITPQALAAVEGSALAGFLTRRLREQIDGIDVASAAARLLSAFTEDRRHQRLFDELLKVFGRFLSDEAAMASIRDKIRQELPTLANLFRADAYLLNKIVASTGALIEEARADPDHALRLEFDRFVAAFVEKMATSPAYAARAEQFKQDLMERPELQGLASEFWAGLRGFVEQDIASDDSAVRRHLADMFVAIGRQLAKDAAIRAEINEGFVVALAAFVEGQKEGVSSFIAEQVRRWDLIQMTRLIELNIGRDLQYIRFNGMIIGGIAGLVLHLGEGVLFRN